VVSSDSRTTAIAGGPSPFVNHRLRSAGASPVTGGGEQSVRKATMIGRQPAPDHCGGATDLLAPRS
jgi:hypothetical protein